ncbi:hypothetical protein E2C01_100795 [Portunus trituberculatus]|uniref:Uncharacterized protein n=1 Tax=Portunus trituberculatus TaxID=210409 RepID=A0A5B7K420_PORTR|nr:hypothetical protein [Portunus trituberculatus]
MRRPPRADTTTTTATITTTTTTIATITERRPPRRPRTGVTGSQRVENQKHVLQGDYRKANTASNFPASARLQTPREEREYRVWV